jgi:hypothetical protein
MNRPLVENKDYLKKTIEELYSMLCDRILEKKVVRSEFEKVSYEVQVAGNNGITFIRLDTEKEWHISKKEMISVLEYMRRNEGFSTPNITHLVERKQSPTVAFLMASDIVY